MRSPAGQTGGWITGRSLPTRPNETGRISYRISAYWLRYLPGVMRLFSGTSEQDSVISAVRSFSVKLAGGINQGLSTLVLILSGIYATSQKISALEIEADQGTITSKEVLSSANTYLCTVLPSQRFVLRLGMALIPIVTICGMALLLRKKYRIDEKEYDRLVKQLEG